MIALKATTLEYESTSAPDNGYRFHVVCTQEDGGWRASLRLHADGYATPEAALEAVARSAREFILQHENAKP
jgi:hypothetical protein